MATPAQILANQQDSSRLRSTDPDARIVAKTFESNPNALPTPQRYAAQAEKSYYKAWREVAAARQMQDEADRVAGLAHHVVRRPNGRLCR